MTYKLLDLFCGAGGSAVGYHRAGFEVVGIDHLPQKHYPFEFCQADALGFLAAYGHEFDIIHASPPCQAYSITRNLKTSRDDHPTMIELVREQLQDTGLPYVIENVLGAPLINPLVLCGSMFGLRVRRHRLFETNPIIYFLPMSCKHERCLPMWWKSRVKFLMQGRKYKNITVCGNSFLMSEAIPAMGIDWMTRKEIAQAIPPAYTEYIGRQIMEAMNWQPSVKP